MDQFRKNTYLHLSMPESARISAALILLASILNMIGCSNVRDAKPTAERAIVEFHERYNAAQYDYIYENTGEEFKKASTEEELSKLLSSVSKKLGRAKSTKTTSWRAGSFNLETTAQMIQDTEFEEGNATESFNFKIIDGKAVLVGYNITSNDLITK